MKVKVHERVDRHGRVWNVTALCDKELLGKKLQEGEVTIDLDKHRDFYDGRIVSKNEAKKLLQAARNVNAVGTKSVECAKKALAIDVRHVKKIQGVPHIQIYYV